MSGRPLKYTVEQAEALINEYFADTPRQDQTVTGLALLFGSKQLLNDYEAREEYSEMIRNAKLRIENIYEQALRSQYTTGAIFALKNFGWRDTQAIDHTTGGEKFKGFKVIIHRTEDETGDTHD